LWPGTADDSLNKDVGGDVEGKLGEDVRRDGMRDVESAGDIWMSRVGPCGPASEDLGVVSMSDG